MIMRDLLNPEHMLEIVPNQVAAEPQRGDEILFYSLLGLSILALGWWLVDRYSDPPEEKPRKS